MYKLHQNDWQRVSGLCPDPLESPREGRVERRIEGGRVVASGLDRTPMVCGRLPPLGRKGRAVGRIEGWRDGFGQKNLACCPHGFT